MVTPLGTLLLSSPPSLEGSLSSWSKVAASATASTSRSMQQDGGRQREKTKSSTQLTYHVFQKLLHNPPVLISLARI